MKGFPPALRRKKRYIAFEVISDERVEFRELINAILNMALTLFGEFYSTHLGLRLEYFDGRLGILRCYRESLNGVKIHPEHDEQGW